MVRRLRFGWRMTGLLAFVLLLGAAAFWFARWYHEQCLEEGQHLTLPNSDWLVVTRYSACGGAVVGGYTEVVAQNVATRQEQLLLRTGNLDGVAMAIDARGALVITLPNIVDVREMKKRLADIEVVYHFTPADDPEERASYQRWRRDPSAPEAVAWFCARVENAARDLPEAYKAMMLESNGCGKATK